MDVSLARAVTIRRACAADLDGLQALEIAVFPGDRLSRRALRHHIGSPRSIFLVADADGTLAGDALVVSRADSDVARLYSIAVAPGQEGRGIGRALLAASEAAARQAGARALRLEVRADNERAATLYRRAGYHEFALVPDYYEDGAGARRMEKTL